MSSCCTCCELTEIIQAAVRELHAECGPDMNIWIVGRKPVGLYQPLQGPLDSGEPEKVRLSMLRAQNSGN
jgi:hypothetical protein